MNDKEKELLGNLEQVCRGWKGTADEHVYLQAGLKYLGERLAKLADLEPAEAAPAVEPAAQ
jgi:hypothetical protein